MHIERRLDHANSRAALGRMLHAKAHQERPQGRAPANHRSVYVYAADGMCYLYHIPNTIKTRVLNALIESAHCANGEPCQHNGRVYIV